MMSPESSRRRLRSNHACLNCRRKKTRCPGEKPACSCCVRLNQPCSYIIPERHSPGDQSHRLADLEEKVNLILNGNMSTSPAQKPSLPERTRARASADVPASGSWQLGFLFADSSALSIADALDLYFEHCHRQLIWCFDPDEVEGHNNIPEELACSILALVSRFAREHVAEWKLHKDNARISIMLRIANNSVELATIESLCLLSYSNFLDGETSHGRFHLGLAFQLCRSAMLDHEHVYTADDPLCERKKRLFWSLQLLEQYYGRQTGLLSIPAEVWRPLFSVGNDMAKPPPLPTDEIGCSESSDIGIWSLTAYFGWIWSRVRMYMSDCASMRMKEPWRHDSMYSMVLADLLEIENRTPLCHRYESVKFYERKAEELHVDRAYWVPWLKLQFMYHATHTVMNHPFLYIMASRHHPNLTLPNSFWRRSSELVLLHATWIVRLIDMISDKHVRLVDPSFAHMAAIAATVQLYYCCAADPRLKYKSNVDLAKCRRFLKTFVPFSSACGALDQSLDSLIQIASGPDNIDNEDWLASKIYLNIPLMWDILRFTDRDPDERQANNILFHSSLTTATRQQDTEDSFNLEIIATASPEISVNTADGGQAVPMAFYSAPDSSATDPPGIIAFGERLVAPAENLIFNTPWLWADASSQFGDMDDDMNNLMNDVEASASSWWNLGNF